MIPAGSLIPVRTILHTCGSSCIHASSIIARFLETGVPHFLESFETAEKTNDSRIMSTWESCDGLGVWADLASPTTTNTSSLRIYTQVYKYLHIDPAASGHLQYKTQIFQKTPKYVIFPNSHVEEHHFMGYVEDLGIHEKTTATPMSHEAQINSMYKQHHSQQIKL